MLTHQGERDHQYVDFAVKFKDRKAIMPESTMFDQYDLETYKVSFVGFKIY